ncbi:MAG: serine/threonine-protein kinase [Acidobacteria bacterium]|nr:serine/threonine-protein kinase [Acidobacteriota bacterium]MCA1649086.1 serine/threonine-protein kinase [Acidobacteriota bacterium]
MPLAKGTRLGPYEISAPLGAGGMGEVYRARDSRLGRDVAIKVLTAGTSNDPERLRRFEQEARAASALNHPNILVLYDVGTETSAPYVVTELLEGETLRARMTAGALSVRKAIDYARQIAHGIRAAHNKGIIHRDLKPENLLVTTDARIKILDFGLAKLKLTDSFGVTTATQSAAGSVVGTVGYMAPEQVRGEPVDSRADLFAFGAVLYEMLEGKRAFRDETPADTLSAILNKEPGEFTPRVPALPPELDRIVRRCLENNPEERFQSASDLAFALDVLSTASTARVEPGKATESRAPRRLWAAGGALLLLFAALAGSSFFAGKRSERRDPPSFQQLTFRRGTIYAARFVADGHTLVYGAEWGGKPLEVFSTRIGSPESRSLFQNASILAMSRGGDIAIALRGPGKEYGVMGGTLARAPLAGGSAREIVADVGWADWAPDGQNVAIVRNVGGQDRLEFPAGKVLYSTSGSITHPRISPAGNLIAFLHHPAGGGDMAGSLVTVDFGGRSRTLSSDWGVIEGLAWSAAGDERSGSLPVPSTLHRRCARCLLRGRCEFCSECLETWFFRTFPRMDAFC